MKYHLTVYRLEKNDEFENEVKDWERCNQMHYNQNIAEYPSRYKDQIALEVIVTEEEFVSIKKAVLEVIK
jgi:hypothetical protein